MNARVRVQLSTMMFIEFFIWGAWFVTMGTYLDKIGFRGTEIALAYSTTAWAAVFSPFFIGMIADRFFSAQKVLGVMHLLGGVLILAASQITSPVLFFIVLLGYALTYMPTLALVNAISFNQMNDPGTEFPSVRVLGTLGWIVAGIIVSILKLEPTAVPLQIAAGASFLLGFYSFALPSTPPKSVGKEVSAADVLGLDALKLMKDPSFAIFIVASLLICIPLSFYYSFANLFFNETGMTNAAAKMSMGQGSELFFMLVMPFFFARLGVKKMLLVGMAAWVGRYFLFAYGNNGPLVAMFYGGILLHGICYDFFFVTGQIYTDRKAPKEIQASAQGFLGLVTYGVGMVIGNYVAGLVVQNYESLQDGAVAGHAWRTVWLIPGIMAGVVMVAFALMFREKEEAVAVEEAAPATVEE